MLQPVTTTTTTTTTMLTLTLTLTPTLADVVTMTTTMPLQLLLTLMTMVRQRLAWMQTSFAVGAALEDAHGEVSVLVEAAVEAVVATDPMASDQLMPQLMMLLLLLQRRQSVASE